MQYCFPYQFHYSYLKTCFASPRRPSARKHDEKWNYKFEKCIVKLFCFEKCIVKLLCFENSNSKKQFKTLKAAGNDLT